jgi:hypothetical protein
MPPARGLEGEAAAMNTRGHVAASTSAIAASTAATALLAISLMWSNWNEFEGTPGGIRGLALTIPFVGAAAARAIFTFNKGRTVVTALVAVGSLFGAAIGIVTCPWRSPLQIMPLGVAWIAAWSFVGAFLAACLHLGIPSRRVRIARAVVSVLALLLLPALLGYGCPFPL